MGRQPGIQRSTIGQGRVINQSELQMLLARALGVQAAPRAPSSLNRVSPNDNNHTIAADSDPVHKSASILWGDAAVLESSCSTDQ